MPITIYSDVVLSDSVVAAEMSGKNMRLNSRVGANSGHESINVIWSNTLREYELGVIPMSIQAWADIEALHEITEGGAYGFLMEDPKDSQVSDGRMTDVSAGVYQLHKRYTHAGSSRYKDRTITRPRAAGFTVTNSGVPVVTYTLDVATGRITIPAAPAAANLRWSGRFYVPVHFLNDAIDWEIARPGNDTTLMLSGPSVVLQEIRE